MKSWKNLLFIISRNFILLTYINLYKFLTISKTSVQSVLPQGFYKTRLYKIFIMKNFLYETSINYNKMYPPY